MSGTLSPLGSYCPSLPPHLPCSLHSNKCHRLGRSRDPWTIAKGTLCPRWAAQMEPIRMEANGQTEDSTSSDEYTMDRRSPCCIYCVMSSSECEGSCLG